MEDTEGERGTNGHSPHCQSLEILRNNSGRRHIQVLHVVISNSLAVKSDDKIILTIFQMS